MRNLNDPKTVITGIGLAFAFWYIVFLTRLLSSFWYRVTVASMILASYARIFGRVTIERDHNMSPTVVLHGVISGSFLYALFFLGYNIFKPLVETNAGSVYQFKTNSPIYIIAISLMITSYCEEYFWRRYLQTSLVKSYGTIGFILSNLTYSLIHLPTCNVALILTALIAGSYWGYLYKYTNSFWIIVISHIIWTELIFVLLPLT